MGSALGTHAYHVGRRYGFPERNRWCPFWLRFLEMVRNSLTRCVREAENSNHPVPPESKQSARLGYLRIVCGTRRGVEE